MFGWIPEQSTADAISGFSLIFALTAIPVSHRLADIARQLKRRNDLKATELDDGNK